jgi:hypothetical protein
VRRAIEAPDVDARPLALPRRMLHALRRVIAPFRRGPYIAVAQATFDFIVSSLLRSRKHRLLLAIYAGFGCALVLAGGAISDRELARALPSAALLSVPLVLVFFGIVGTRVLLAIPIELGANWIFQIAEREDREPYRHGTRAALLAVGAGPVLGASLPAYSLYWGPWIAVAHAVYVGILALLLAEVLLIGFCKIPFTCTYLPGNSNARLLWPLYIFAFTTYAYTMASLELVLLQHPRAFLIVLLVLVAAWRATDLRNRHALARAPELIYEDELDSATTLNLGPAAGAIKGG